MTVAGSLDYDPFGNPIDPHGTLDTPFGYGLLLHRRLGEYTDPTGETHLLDALFLRARNYDPTLGAFTSLDPFEGLVSEPMSLNGYSYANNNPVMHTDPSGHYASLVGGLIGAGLGAGLADKAYLKALNGDCGCPAKNKALNTDRFGFVFRYGVAGGVIGAIVASTLWPLRTSARALTDAVAGLAAVFNYSFLRTIVGTVEAMWNDFKGNLRLDNTCYYFDFALDLIENYAVDLYNASKDVAEQGLELAEDAVDIVSDNISGAISFFTWPWSDIAIFGDGSQHPPNSGPVQGGGNGEEPIQVTESLIRARMQGASLRTKQTAVSLPKIQRIVREFEAGRRPETYSEYIQVDEDIIVDGNHRYITARVVDYDWPTRSGSLPRFEQDKPIIDWQDITIDPVDWGD